MGDISALMNDPAFKDATPEERLAVMKLAGIPTPTATALPPRTGAPSSPLDLSPAGMGGRPGLTGGLATNPLAPYTAQLESGMDQFKKNAQRVVPEAITSLTSPVLGTTGGAAASKAISFPLSMIPTRVGEAVGDIAMAMAPEEEGARNVATRIFGPPLAAYVASLASGSQASPTESAIYTGLGSLGGEVGLNAIPRLHLGGVGSKRMEGILAEDLERVASVMSTDMPDMVPAHLSSPSELLDHFHKMPDQLFPEGKQSEDLLKEYAQKAGLMKQLRKQAQRLQARTANMPPALAAHWNQGPTGNAARVAKLLADADAIEAKKTQGMALKDAFERKSREFLALKKFFGNKINYQGYGDSYRRLVFNTARLQDHLGKGDEVAKLLEAGVPEEAILNMKRAAYGTYGAEREQIMTGTDVAAQPFEPGFRLHYYHALPRPITHLNLPRPARLAGAARQAKIMPSPYWQKFGSPLMARLGYGLLGTPVPPLEEEPNSENTFMRTGPGER